MVINVGARKMLEVQVIDDRILDSSMLVSLLDEALETVTRTDQAQNSGAGPAGA